MLHRSCYAAVCELVSSGSSLQSNAYDFTLLHAAQKACRIDNATANE